VGRRWLAARRAANLVPIEHAQRVPAHDLVDRVGLEPGEEPLGDLAAVRPGAVGVGIVGLERDLFGSDGVEGGEAGGVVEEAAVDAPQ
jgi:hypothetical protein